MSQHGRDACHRRRGGARFNLPRDQHRRDPLSHVERHGAHTNFLRRCSEEIRRPYIAAAGPAQINAAMPTRQQIRERDRPQQVSGDEDDKGGQVHGSTELRAACARAEYAGPFGERRLSYKVTRSIRHGPARASMSASLTMSALATRSRKRASVR